MKNQLNFLLLFTLAFCSCNNSTQNENNIEEDIMTIVRKDGWLFQHSMGCDQLSDFEVGDWDVKGIWITKDSLIAITIREGYNYKKDQKWNNLSDLKNAYPEQFDQISKRIEGNKYDKFGLLFYEGSYNCENGISIQRDTILVMFGDSYTNKEYYQTGLATGP